MVGSRIERGRAKLAASLQRAEESWSTFFDEIV
jgi:hypothetical protein